MPAVLVRSASFLRTPMTRLAPICFATFTAADPTAPDAPSTSTISLGETRPAVTIAVHAVRYPRPKVAACSKLSCLGFSTNASTGTATNCACEPFRLNPRFPPVPKTSLPFHIAGPSTTIPAKSLPGTRGGLVSEIFPSTPLGSLGLIAAACTRTRASPPSVAIPGTSTFSTRKFASEPVSRKYRAFIVGRIAVGDAAADNRIPFIGLIFRETHNLARSDGEARAIRRCC